MQNLARYIIRAAISQERMTYLENEGKVLYQSKYGSAKKEFSPLEWLINVCSHFQNPGESTINYNAFFSNFARGKRQKKQMAFRFQRSMRS
ncbi:MAG: transposase [Candidatus Riflebacteria bacterium]|nr:transposase [Candidatus Riflebacteria bacterium]